MQTYTVSREASKIDAHTIAGGNASFGALVEVVNDIPLRRAEMIGTAAGNASSGDANTAASA